MPAILAFAQLAASRCLCTSTMSLQVPGLFLDGTDLSLLSRAAPELCDLSRRLRSLLVWLNSLEEIAYSVISPCKQLSYMSYTVSHIYYLWRALVEPDEF